MTYKCRECDVELDDDNWYPSLRKNRNCICKECHTKHSSLWAKNNPEKVKASWTTFNRNHGMLPISENHECSQYLGIHIVERLLRHIFKNVEVMPIGNPGYDFICNRGMKVDSKSSCIRKNQNNWQFDIKHNIIADYFILVAFDNRQDLNPLHIWLIPGHVLNHLACASISPSTIHKWDEYKQDLVKVMICCDTMKGKVIKV